MLHQAVDDVERLVLTDSPAEAVARIGEVATTQFGLSYAPRRRWYLAEVRQAAPRQDGTTPRRA